MSLRRELHRRGLRYRVDVPLPWDRRRRVDVLFPRERVAIYVDGCFWHGCPQHGTSPKSNSEWWASKIRLNRERDVRATCEWTLAGYTVVRVWEHEVSKDAALRIQSLVLERRADRD